MRLSNFTQNRDNNFNLIRVIAALAVLVSHSFALAIGSSADEPCQQRLGMSLGGIAVDIFFITSGFLVTASLLTRQSIIDYLWARVLRIFPALLIMLVITVFGMGVFFTTLPLQSYLTSSMTWAYVLKCATLLRGVAWTLPGVFGDNLKGHIVNGSLWTMPYELKMYVLLAIVWIGLRLTQERRLVLFRSAVVVGFLASGILFFVNRFVVTLYDQNISRFAYMFFSGALYYVVKDHIILVRAMFWLFVAGLLISAQINTGIFFAIYVLTLPYVLFYCAYIPAGFIRGYNRVGDYSYGIYIYAYPVQQSVAALIPSVSVYMMISLSAVITLMLAGLSWHLVERRALDLKGMYVGHTRRILAA